MPEPCTETRWPRQVPVKPYMPRISEWQRASSRNASAIHFARSGSPGIRTVGATSPCWAPMWVLISGSPRKRERSEWLRGVGSRSENYRLRGGVRLPGLRPVPRCLLNLLAASIGPRCARTDRARTVTDANLIDVTQADGQQLPHVALSR